MKLELKQQRAAECNPRSHSGKAALIGTAIGIFASAAGASLTDGLVAYYPLDGSANDASGNSNNGTAHGGVAFVDGIRGQAAKFNGSTSFIQIANASVGNLGMNGTLSFWFIADPGNVGTRLFEKDDRAYWWFSAGDTHVVADVRSTQSYGPPQWHLVGQTPTITSAAWTAVALRKNGTTLDLFINGQLMQSVSDAAPNVVTTAPLTLGRSYYWNTAYYQGLLDEVRVYDRALTDGEVMQLAAVPEPSVAATLTVGMLLLALRRKAASSDA